MKRDSLSGLFSQGHRIKFMTRDNKSTYLRELPSELDYDMLLRQRFGVPIAGLSHNPQTGYRGQVSTVLRSRCDVREYGRVGGINEPRLLVLRETFLTINFRGYRAHALHYLIISYTVKKTKLLILLLI